MDANTLVTIISTVGFPILACLGTAWFCKYLVDKYTTIITETMDKLAKSIDDLKEELLHVKGE